MADSRKEFEKWAKSHHGASIERHEAGEYRSAPTDFAWTGWKAGQEHMREQAIEAMLNAVRALPIEEEK